MIAISGEFTENPFVYRSFLFSNSCYMYACKIKFQKKKETKIILGVCQLTIIPSPPLVRVECFGVSGGLAQPLA
jgi:hypothetical protein